MALSVNFILLPNRLIRMLFFGWKRKAILSELFSIKWNEKKLFYIANHKFQIFIYQKFILENYCSILILKKLFSISNVQIKTVINSYIITLNKPLHLMI